MSCPTDIFYICNSIDNNFEGFFKIKFCCKHFSTLLYLQKKNPHLKAASFWELAKAWFSATKRLQFLFRVARGRLGSGGCCSARRSGSFSSFFLLFPPPHLSPRKCSSGADCRRDFEGSCRGAGSWADPEPRGLLTCSALAMRVLGAAAAAALGRGPLPRIPAVLGWQGKQVLVPR